MSQAVSNLPIGAKLKLGRYSVNGEAAQEIIWLVVAKNHTSTPAYPSNSITLIAEKIIDLRCFDAAEPTNPNSGIKTNGLAGYELANIRQWLNSTSTGAWYVAKHTYDQAPTADYVRFTTPYDTRPGFLSAFTTNERNAILATTTRYYNYQTGSIDLIDKVFLPALVEVTGNSTYAPGQEGSQYAYFVNRAITANLTGQAFTNTRSIYKPNTVNENWGWWTRSAVNGASPNGVYTISSNGGSSGSFPYDGSVGIRPALNITSDIKASDITDSDGCYNLIFNTAPTAPSIINVPTIYGGKSNPISWNSATDPEGDTITYQLECSINSGTYSEIYKGAASSYAHLVPFGTSTVSYRVRATDPSGAYSSYTTSSKVTVINNNPPVIDGADSNLGVKQTGFTGTYKVTDANNNTVTVTESIDGVQIRSLVAPLGETITYGITDSTWLALSNGSHTLTIRATDGIDSVVRTHTFTKLVESFTISNATPWYSNSRPNRILIIVSRNIPAGATFKVEVCNNANDDFPKWEDATNAVLRGLIHPFSNYTVTAGNGWGVKIRVTVNRNGATGACYVSAIGGNFE